jgi:D-alanyl-D-alanine carboxypeptidase-like protein
VPWLAHVVATKDFPVPWPDGTTAHFGNIDRFVNEYPNAVGVKNGYTTLAGNCVAAAAVRDGKTLVVVVMNDPHVYDTAAHLMDAGFESGVPIGTWKPDELPQQVAPSVDAVRNLAVAKTQDVVEPVIHHHFPLRLVVAGIVLLWGARVIQIRRRRIRRRRAQREARMAARRARVDQLYVGPRPDVSPQDVWLTSRPFEVDDEPRKPQRRRVAR